MNLALQNMVAALRNKDVSDWERIRQRVADEHVKSLPEVKVVEALRAYLDGCWAGPGVAGQLWQEVLKALRTLDEAEVARIEAKNKSRAG